MHELCLFLEANLSGATEAEAEAVRCRVTQRPRILNMPTALTDHSVGSVIVIFLDFYFESLVNYTALLKLFVYQ